MAKHLGIAVKMGRTSLGLTIHPEIQALINAPTWHLKQKAVGFQKYRLIIMVYQYWLGMHRAIKNIWIALLSFHLPPGQSLRRQTHFYVNLHLLHAFSNLLRSITPKTWSSLDYFFFLLGICHLTWLKAHHNHTTFFSCLTGCCTSMLSYTNVLTYLQKNTRPSANKMLLDICKN